MIPMFRILSNDIVSSHPAPALPRNANRAQYIDFRAAVQTPAAENRSLKDEVQLPPARDFAGAKLEDKWGLCEPRHRENGADMLRWATTPQNHSKSFHLRPTITSMFAGTVFRPQTPLPSENTIRPAANAPFFRSPHLSAFLDYKLSFIVFRIVKNNFCAFAFKLERNVELIFERGFDGGLFFQRDVKE